MVNTTHLHTRPCWMFSHTWRISFQHCEIQSAFYTSPKEYHLEWYITSGCYFTIINWICDSHRLSSIIRTVKLESTMSRHVATMGETRNYTEFQWGNLLENARSDDWRGGGGGRGKIIILILGKQFVRMVKESGSGSCTMGALVFMGLKLWILLSHSLTVQNINMPWDTFSTGWICHCIWLQVKCNVPNQQSSHCYNLIQGSRNFSSLVTCLVTYHEFPLPAFFSCFFFYSEKII